MKTKEDKYIELLLKKCMDVNKSKSLLISYNSINSDFVEKLVKKAKRIGFKDIFLDEKNLTKEVKLLNELTVEEIKTHSYFNEEKWDEYAKKKGNFLMFSTYVPGAMEDIPSEKLSASAKARRDSKPIYKEMQNKSQIPWCIACLPNKKWAKYLFPKEKNSYERLEETIYKLCMVDEKNPIKNWEEHLKLQRKLIKKLNNLKIKTLHYTNSLGTDLYLDIADNSLWTNVDNSGKTNIVNMPSYEIFTNVKYTKTKGTVYSTMPLIYNGKEIKDFYLEFKKGKVVDFDAKKGKNLLKEIIDTDEFSSYLGEVALVSNKSPIALTNIVFADTLFDENASCHLALGSGFAECIKNFNKYKNEELKEMGVNPSKNHVDFMIGSDDLKIEAITDKGKVVIFDNGDFVL